MDDGNANLIGKQFGNYRLETLLGEGGMGYVYRAVHPQLGKHVAIKILRPEISRNKGAVERLMDEARASTAIGHQNIIQIFDFGQTEDQINYMVMEFLEGETLYDRIQREGRLTPEAVVEIGVQACAGLDAAHRQGIIHRDIKPHNIFIQRNAQGSDHVKILDFGAAKLLDIIQRTSPKTTSGAVIGTPMYMAPEHAKGEEVDGRTDLYSLAMVLYYALSGALPFQGATYTAVLAKVLADEAPALNQLMPTAGISEALDRTILRALKKLPAERFPNISSFRRALELANPAIMGTSTASPEFSPTIPIKLATPSTEAKTKIERVPNWKLSDAEKTKLERREPNYLGTKLRLSSLILGIIQLVTCALIFIKIIPFGMMAVILFALTSTLMIGAIEWVRREHHRNEQSLAKHIVALDQRVTEQSHTINRQEPLRHFLAIPVVEAIFAGSVVAQVTYSRKKLTMVAIVLDDFYKITAKMSAEEQALLLNQLFAIATKVADRFHAVVDCFFLSTVTVFVGAPNSSGEEKDAQAAIQLALQLVQQFEEVLTKRKELGADRLRLLPKIGIHSAMATVGNFGSEFKLQYSTMSAEMSLAVQAANLAPPGDIVVTHSTRLLVGKLYEYTQNEKVQLAPFTEAIVTYRLKAPAEPT